MSVLDSGMAAAVVEVETANGDEIAIDLCVLVNGSRVGCGLLDPRGRPPRFTEQVLFPAAVLTQDSGSWLSLELTTASPDTPDKINRVVHAGTPPIRVRLPSQDDTAMRSLLNSTAAAYPSVSLVLTLTLRDLPRATALFASLAHQLRCGSRDGGAGDDAALEPCWLLELVVVVPRGRTSK